MCAGVVIALSTAYRAWLDWRADVRLPMVALGSPDRAELAGFVKYLVSRILERSRTATVAPFCTCLPRPHGMTRVCRVPSGFMVWPGQQHRS
jgi:hypothetical protein